MHDDAHIFEVAGDIAGRTSQSGRPVTLFGDIVEKLCCHPAYRLLSLRSLPQMPAGSIDFTTFTWPAILRRLHQMQITGGLSTAAAVSTEYCLTE